MTIDAVFVKKSHGFTVIDLNIIKGIKMTTNDGIALQKFCCMGDVGVFHGIMTVISNFQFCAVFGLNIKDKINMVILERQWMFRICHRGGICQI